METAPSAASATNDPVAPLTDSPDPMPTMSEVRAAENGADEQIPPAPRPGDGPAEASSPASAPIERPRRSIKVILRLQPSDGPGYRVLLAVGADGCDPLYRTLDVDDLQSALAAIPEFVTNAEERWQHAPRYSTSTMPSRSKRRATASGEPEAPVPPPAPPVTVDNGPASPTPRTTAKPVPADQLPLF